MELKALMQKLEIINNKQYLTESEEKEQTDKKSCPPMSHVKKMCQDGKSVSEICKMHPDCDHTELKQMVADCKKKLGESAKYRDPKYKDKLYTQEPRDYDQYDYGDDDYYNPKPDNYPGEKNLKGGGEFDHNDPLRKGYGRHGTGSMNTHGKRKGMPSRDHISSLKGSIKDAHGTHTRPNLPEASMPMKKVGGKSVPAFAADGKGKNDLSKKKTNESIVFTSSIARGLVEEFGYKLGEELVSEVAFTPEQQAKMGKANPQDPYIVARVLGKDAVPLSHFTDPEDQKIAKQMGFKDGGAAAPAAGLSRGGAATKPAQPNVAQAAATANPLDDKKTAADPTQPVNPMAGVKPDAAAQASRIADRMDAEAGANTAGTQPADPTKPANPMAGGKPPAGGAGGDAAVAATREKFKALMDKLEKTGGVSGSAPAPAANAVPPLTKKPATGAATKPAAPVTGAQSAGQSVGGAVRDAGAGIANFAKGAYQGLTGKANESVSFEDDKILLAIKNIRY